MGTRINIAKKFKEFCDREPVVKFNPTMDAKGINWSMKPNPALSIYLHIPWLFRSEPIENTNEVLCLAFKDVNDCIAHFENDTDNKELREDARRNIARHVGKDYKGPLYLVCYKRHLPRYHG